MGVYICLRPAYVAEKTESPRRRAAGYLQMQCNAASGGELNPCPPLAEIKLFYISFVRIVGMLLIIVGIICFFSI
jgi:hypothetical protein